MSKPAACPPYSCSLPGLALLSALLPAGPALAQQTGPAATPAPLVVNITGKFTSDLRPYSRFLPGLREFRTHHALAPAAELRFALVTRSPPMQPLPLVQARLEKRSFWGDDWTMDLPIRDDGWFTLPESEEAEWRNADVVVSRRKAKAVKWIIDVRTPGLPPQAYRLGDLRLECRVYLAIEWGRWHGAMVMGRVSGAVGAPPMDTACGGPASVFFNTRPWPRLKAYVLSEGERSQRRELDGLQPGVDAFMLDLGHEDGAPAWSDDALVEFVFAGDGRPAPAPTANAGP